MLERGEKINELADKSADLENASSNFLAMAQYVFVFVYIAPIRVLIRASSSRELRKKQDSSWF
jgi:hypothetical protein